jgi:hypothetical protein
MKKVLFSLFAIGLLTGCADKYTCGQFPSSGCQPVSTVYKRTNDGLHDYRKSLFEKEQEEKEKAAKDNKSKTIAQRMIHVGQANRSFNYVAPGDPILTKPVTLRILFNSWQDKDKDLNSGGYVFIRVRDAEWVGVK